jgi:hypothetical protein
MLSDLERYDTDVLYHDWMESSGTFVSRDEFIAELRHLEDAGLLEVKVGEDEIIVVDRREQTAHHVPR